MASRPYRRSYRRKRRARNRFPCPTCKREDAIGVWDQQRGYQCRECTLRDEALYGAPEGGQS